MPWGRFGGFLRRSNGLAPVDASDPSDAWARCCGGRRDECRSGGVRVVVETGHCVGVAWSWQRTVHCAAVPRDRTRRITSCGGHWKRTHLKVTGWDLPVKLGWPWVRPEPIHLHLRGRCGCDWRCVCDRDRGCQTGSALEVRWKLPGGMGRPGDRPWDRLRDGSGTVCHRRHGPPRTQGRGNWPRRNDLHIVDPPIQRAHPGAFKLDLLSVPGRNGVRVCHRDRL